MIIEELKEVNDAITMMEELSLPISMQKLKERDSLESKYLEDILIPQIKDQIQSLSEPIHKPFCLVVDYQHGLPVQVKIAEKTKLKVDVNRGKVKKVVPQKSKVKNGYVSEPMQTEWQKYIAALPKGNNSLYYALNQSFLSLSKLLRVVQEKSIRKYITPLFEILKIPTSGSVSPASFKELLQPEQFVIESSKDGDTERIVLWKQKQQIKKTIDGARVKVFEEDGVTPVMIDEIKKIKEGQWSVKILCELMTQRDYFANQHK